mmetsp:Transcript_50437/g.99638  ORF Transcript_50437/g.99638 Transcript_50437/m.99638 type:complete len:192 (-) Transcript_50437:83-658(-)|eukprot:CAMPEP_0170224164 /NCGR_PEP_ID=MMETSP0116_2-20130129/11783_1 /TAXON_ID=400756 /ORGANISM="Durinskia baltica, Strain CSIRO CS-38" /LENGTH=191 /DNA_ID=CAMNT_0010474869 /DNA_START=93 /DNA_END=668 /DNA_ORIENTATION=+
MTKFGTAATAAALLIASSSWTHGWTIPETKNLNRRDMVLGFLGAATTAVTLVPQEAQATTAKTGLGSPFTGDYNDPNHPNCLRQVKVVGAPLRGDGTRSAYPVMEITGYDGKAGSATCTDRPTRADLWKVEGTVKSTTEAYVDFSPKGGPTKMLAKFEDGGIVFPDGNKWVKVAGGTKDRLPLDMFTLKSE